MKKGTLTGVGVGPGDPEHITLKAFKALKSVDVICAPRSGKSKSSLALSIVKQTLENLEEEHEILEPLFPMIEDKKALERYWEEAAQLIIRRLDQGQDVAFITMGDPTVYSTFSYVQKIIKEQGFETEIIPGITSFTSCAASAGVSLGEKDEIIVIVPKVDNRLDRIMGYGDTLVIMKTSRHPDLLRDTINRDKRDHKVISVQNCSMEDEMVFEGFVTEKKYFSTTIVKFKPGIPHRKPIQNHD